MTANDRVREFLTAPYDPSADSPDEVPASEVTRNVGVSLLFFSLGRSYFGLPAASIRAILEAPRLITVPFVQYRLCPGFIHLQGAPIPLLDVRALMGLPDNNQRSGKTIIVESESLLTGIDTDAVVAVATTEVREAGTLQLAHRSVVHRLAIFAGTPITVLSPSDLTDAVHRRNV